VMYDHHTFEFLDLRRSTDWRQRHYTHSFNV
jgi:hypothetical protein